MPTMRCCMVKGRGAIAAYYDDVCGRAMTHRVETSLADGDRLAFAQSCAYPDGMKVYCSAMIELDALPAPDSVHQPDHDTLLQRQHAFGYTNEDLRLIVGPMASERVRWAFQAMTGLTVM